MKMSIEVEGMKGALTGKPDTRDEFRIVSQIPNPKKFHENNQNFDHSTDVEERTTHESPTCQKEDDREPTGSESRKFETPIVSTRSDKLISKTKRNNRRRKKKNISVCIQETQLVTEEETNKADGVHDMTAVNPSTNLNQPRKGKGNRGGKKRLSNNKIHFAQKDNLKWMQAKMANMKLQNQPNKSCYPRTQTNLLLWDPIKQQTIESQPTPLAHFDTSFNNHPESYASPCFGYENPYRENHFIYHPYHHEAFYHQCSPAAFSVHGSRTSICTEESSTAFSSTDGRCDASRSSLANPPTSNINTTSVESKLSARHTVPPQAQPKNGNFLQKENERITSKSFIDRTIVNAKTHGDILAEITYRMYFNPIIEKENAVPASVYVEERGARGCYKTPPSLSILEMISCAWDRHRPFADGETFTTFALVTQKLITREKFIGFDPAITSETRRVLLSAMLCPSAYYQLCKGAIFISQAMERCSPQETPKERSLILFMALHFFLPPEFVADLIWQCADLCAVRVNRFIPLEFVCHQLKSQLILQLSAMQGQSIEETQNVSFEMVMEPLRHQQIILHILEQNLHVSSLLYVMQTIIWHQFDFERYRSRNPHTIFSLVHACAEISLGSVECSQFVIELMTLLYPFDLFCPNCEGRLPIHIALDRQGGIKSFKEVLLLTQSFSPGIILQKDGLTGQNALHLAATRACKDKIEKIELLYGMIRAMPDRLQELFF